MRREGAKRARRPLVVVVCSILRVERRLRGTCGPCVRRLARVVVRVVGTEGEGAPALAGHIVVAAASSAGFSIVATVTGLGSAELCKIASALVIGALAAAAARSLVRRRMRGQSPFDLRPLLATTARTLLAEHGRLPAARVLRVVLAPPLSTAQASLGGALAALAPPLDAAAGAALVRWALRPVTRILPGMGVALDVHDAYLESRDNARFVRDFALTAASLCPSPRALPLLCT